MNNKFSKRKAFTLIELLIVIAIIGILFIVLVSKVDFATDKAKATGVQTDFRSFQVAIESVAKENAGLATLGWDTGDINGNRIRDSYDKGDTNKNGVQDAGETFVGSKVYDETWTNIYTLTNPADANDKSAIAALEAAINKNLDPKLHITIHDDLTITMANGAQDPWNTEYHGYYITNALNDGKDRGAIIIYSNGANQEWGSEHSIANGIVTVNIPGNNVYGKDDYSIASVYTYKNGYGEIKTTTTGFSQNQGGGQAVGDHVNDNTGGGNSGEGNVDEITSNTGLFDDAGNVIATWDELINKYKLNVTMSHEVGYDYNTLEDEPTSTYNVLRHQDLEHATKLVIPGNVGHIGDYAFYKTTLKTIEILDGVVSIGYGAFSETVNLSVVKLPNTLLEISDEAFASNEHLESINIPNSVTKIGNYAFWDCPSIRNISIPSNVEAIGMGAFNVNLSAYSYENGIYYIGDWVSHADADISVANIREGTVGIIGEAFIDNSSLTSVTIPDTVKFIGDWAFANCYYLEDVKMSKNIEYLGESVFDFCSSLPSTTYNNGIYLGVQDNPHFILVSVAISGETEYEIHPDTVIINNYAVDADGETITIPANVISVGANAFLNCTKTKTLIVETGSKLAYIGPCAFDTYYIETIHLPGSLKYIGEDAFGGTQDTNVYFNGTLADWCQIEFVNMNSNPLFATSAYGNPHGYLHIQNVLVENIVIPDSVKVIHSYAFSNATTLVSVTIPASVIEIEASAFELCESIETVTFASGSQLKSIGYAAFYYNKMTSVELPQSLTYIGGYAFNFCPMSELTLPENVAVFDYLISTNVTKLTVLAKNPPAAAYIFVSSNVNEVFVPAESVEAYKTAPGWSVLASRIKPIE